MVRNGSLHGKVGIFTDKSGKDYPFNNWSIHVIQPFKKAGSLSNPDRLLPLHATWKGTFTSFYPNYFGTLPDGQAEFKDDSDSYSGEILVTRIHPSHIIFEGSGNLKGAEEFFKNLRRV